MKVKIIPPNTTFGKTKYELLEPYKYKDFVVPAGFITDGASVPRVFWNIFPPVGRYFYAAVVHDYLLSLGFRWVDAANHFKQSLLSTGVKKWVANVMYWAVRLNGFVKGYKR